jgi:hypothetical protein
MKKSQGIASEVDEDFPSNLLMRSNHQVCTIKLAREVDRTALKGGV